MGKKTATTTKKTVKKAATKSKDGRYRILSLDGGGIRGLMTAIWLAELEKLVGPLHKRFDLIAGTSTGSILAAGVASQLPASRIVDMYRDNGKQIFPGAAGKLWSRAGRFFTEGPSAPKYSDAGLATVLRRVFGEKRFGDLGKRPIVMVTSYNTLAREAVVFKTSDEQYDSLPLWEVVKSSCSAPTYFPAHVMAVGNANVPLIDGGVVANNPTACAIAEAARENSDRRKMRSAAPIGPQIEVDVDPEPCELENFVVASFGTGSLTRPIGIEDAKEWGALEWAVPIIDVLFDGAADAVDYMSSYLIPSERYFRFQTPLDAAYDDMDNADATNLNALMQIADSYLAKEGNDKIKALAALIS